MDIIRTRNPEISNHSSRLVNLSKYPAVDYYINEARSNPITSNGLKGRLEFLGSLALDEYPTKPTEPIIAISINPSAQPIMTGAKQKYGDLLKSENHYHIDITQPGNYLPALPPHFPDAGYIQHIVVAQGQVGLGQYVDNVMLQVNDRLKFKSALLLCGVIHGATAEELLKKFDGLTIIAGQIDDNLVGLPDPGRGGLITYYALRGNQFDKIVRKAGD